MPAFDVVSEVDQHELTNAVDQTNREITNRFDFRGTNTSVEQKEREITVSTESDFQVKQVIEILQSKMIKRGLDVSCLDQGEITKLGKGVRMVATAKHGIDKDMARKIVKIIKDEKLKVQAAIQGEQVRVTGKKRDDLQTVIVLLKEAGLDQPVQFTNFRD